MAVHCRAVWRPRSFLVQCLKPFNGETPHHILMRDFTTPEALHFVRNHMPLPVGLSADNHRQGPCTAVATWNSRCMCLPSVCPSQTCF
jgi:hypothetical protein